MSGSTSDALMGLACALIIVGGMGVLFWCLVALGEWIARPLRRPHPPSFVAEPLDKPRSFPSRCIPGRHDWLLPADGRPPYCIRCGEPMPQRSSLRDPEDDTIVDVRARERRATIRDDDGVIGGRA